jgi:bacterioferritin-associated ferredoxin
MPRKRLPDFCSPSTDELRALWRACGGGSQCGQFRRVIAEVIRLRELVEELDAYCIAVQRVWSAETHSTLVGLERMRILFSDERSRLSGLRAPPTPPPDADQRTPRPPPIKD